MLTELWNRLRLFTELPMQALQDRIAIKPAPRQLIPPHVYQTWETNLFGKTHLKEIQYFRSINSDLNFTLFTQALRQSYMQEFWGNHPIYRIFQQTQFGPMRADIFRYCILFERGGFYFDISKGCSVPLSTMYPSDADGLISFESNDCVLLPNFRASTQLAYPDKLVLHWGMGFAPAHPILGRMIENICEYYPYFKNKVFDSPKSAILRYTGPGMFTKSVREVFDDAIIMNVSQAGIDFNGKGIFALKGSWVRYSHFPSYTKSKAMSIVM